MVKSLAPSETCLTRNEKHLTPSETFLHRSKKSLSPSERLLSRSGTDCKRWTIRKVRVSRLPFKFGGWPAFLFAPFSQRTPTGHGGSLSNQLNASLGNSMSRQALFRYKKKVLSENYRDAISDIMHQRIFHSERGISTVDTTACPWQKFLPLTAYFGSLKLQNLQQNIRMLWF